MTREQINVRLPPQLIADAKARGGLTQTIEAALTAHLYGSQGDGSSDLLDDHERRISRLEEMAGL
jgi:hypothetical protein